MKVLVLCVDRDNDVGEKTKIKSPIVGRNKNLKTAVALGLKDPEDPDMNSMFAAISLYDSLASKDMDVEIATICGDVNVGVKSDTRLTAELDDVIKTTKPDVAYLVSDGTEDEYIYPLVSSRLKINHVERVLIKQSHTLETTYQIIVKMFREEKIRKKIFTPIGLALTIMGICTIIPTLVELYYNLNIELIRRLPMFGLGMICIVVGIYTLVVTYRVVEKISTFFKKVSITIKTSKVSGAFTGVACILIIIGIYSGVYWNTEKTLTERILTFTQILVLWLVFAIWIFHMGRAIQKYLRRGRFPKTAWVFTSSLLSATFIIYGILIALRLLLTHVVDPTGFHKILFICIIGGLSTAIVGGILYHYISVKTEKESRWRY